MMVPSAMDDGFQSMGAANVTPDGKSIGPRTL